MRRHHGMREWLFQGASMCLGRSAANRSGFEIWPIRRARWKLPGPLSVLIDVQHLGQDFKSARVLSVSRQRAGAGFVPLVAHETEMWDCPIWARRFASIHVRRWPRASCRSLLAENRGGKHVAARFYGGFIHGLNLARRNFHGEFDHAAADQDRDRMNSRGIIQKRATEASSFCWLLDLGSNQGPAD